MRCYKILSMDLMNFMPDISFPVLMSSAIDSGYLYVAYVALPLAGKRIYVSALKYNLTGDIWNPGLSIINTYDTGLNEIPCQTAVGGSYVFVASATSGSNTLKALYFNGSTLTLKDTVNPTGTTSLTYALACTPDGSAVFIITYSAPALLISKYTFNGTTLTFDSSTALSAHDIVNVQGLKVTSDSIFLAFWNNTSYYNTLRHWPTLAFSSPVDYTTTTVGPAFHNYKGLYAPSSSRVYAVSNDNTGSSQAYTLYAWDVTPTTLTLLDSMQMLAPTGGVPTSISGDNDYIVAKGNYTDTLTFSSTYSMIYSTFNNLDLNGFTSEVTVGLVTKVNEATFIINIPDLAGGSGFDIMSFGPEAISAYTDVLRIPSE
jgi:hypothetical protein